MGDWVQCVECEGTGMRDTGGVQPWGDAIFVPCDCDTLTEIDNDGETVRAGDLIAFSFGIPGRRVEGRLFARNGQLIMPTPDVTPKEATIPMLRKHVGGFWKVSQKTIESREQSNAD